MSSGVIRRKDVQVDPRSCNEFLGVKIAGPETAAELGVPIGTPIEARHVMQDRATGEQHAFVVSPGVAKAIQERINTETGEGV